MPEEKKTEFSFQLKALELHEHSLIKPAGQGLSITNFNFDINLESNVDINSKLVIIFTKIRILADDQSTQLGSLTSATIFSLANFDDVVKLHSNNSFELPDELANTFNSIALSSTRGMMFSEFKGTLLHHALLPIIDLKSLRKEI